MKEKKESYKHILPHFQQPGQAYFVTWCLQDSIPPKALAQYTLKLQEIKVQIDFRKKHNEPDQMLEELTLEYYQIRKKYLQVFDNLLAENPDRSINLNKPELSDIIVEAMKFWEVNRIENYAWCIMPNHVHWVFLAKETDEIGNPVYLQDILHSIKRHSANQINKAVGRKGKFWQKESFDTTIRDDKHLMNAINYTLNNPVVAGFVKEWSDWPGCWCAGF
ncbi:MAG: transposase [Bacteroidota bacterium]|nr:transposase [Bacteroidota bacterium]